MGKLIQKAALTPTHQLTQLVEFKTSYYSQVCELHLFETHKSAENVALYFNDLTFTAMIRGKKSVKLGHSNTRFDYTPGSSVIVSPQEEMLINFPDADEDPSQCLALTIPEEYITNTLQQLNLSDTKINEASTWQINSDEYFITNNEGIASATNNILRILKEDHPMKDEFANLALKELVIRMSQSQAFNLLKKDKLKGRFAELIKFIKSNLHQKLHVDKLAKLVHLSTSNFYKMFKQELGVAPNEFILHLRIKKAKELLTHKISVNEVAYETGFSDANYFIKAFKKIEGITPKHFQLHQKIIS